MKTGRIVFLNLTMVLVLVLAGCGPAQPAEPAAQVIEGENLLSPSEAVEEVAGLSTPTSVPASAPAPPAVAAMTPVAQNATSAGTQAIVAPTPTVAVPDLPPLNRTVNILLLGSDRRPRDPNWRTDVMMLIALDMQSNQAGVISFPRDIFIDEIPNHRPNKMNVVDYLGEQDEPGGGGPALLASILEAKTGVPVHYYLRFEFESFKQVVDALDGVEIDIECRVYEYLPEEDINLYLEPGIHRLSGKIALAYVRARNQGGDLERARRQQRMVWAVRNQLLTENQLPNVPALYAALKDAVQTDIGFVSAIRFTRFALGLSEDNIHGMVIAPPEMVRSGWRLGMSVFVADWPVIAEEMHTVLTRPPLIQTNTVGAEGDRVRCP